MKRITVFKGLSILCAMMFFFSCSKNGDNNSVTNSEPTKMLCFANFDELNDTYLSLFNLTRDEFEVWAIENNHESLYMSDTDADYKNFSNSLRRILNKDGKYQVGDSVYMIDKSGDVFAYKKGQKNDTKLVDHVVSMPLDEFNNSSLKYISISVGQKGPADYQQQFNLTNYAYNACNGITKSANGALFKFVHELWVENYNNQYIAYLRLKLEYASKWNEASEFRNIILSLTLYNQNGSYIKSISESLKCVRYHYEYLLFTTNNGDSNYWTGSKVRFSLTGSITHQVVKDSYIFYNDVNDKWGLYATYN